MAEHQKLNSIIEELEAVNASEETKLSQLGTNLRQAETMLQKALDNAKPRLDAIQLANKRPVDVDDVISYGSKIGASIAAPPGWDPTQPLGSHLPPAPPEEMMRAGRLAAIGNQATAKGDDDDSPMKIDTDKSSSAPNVS